MAQLLSYFLDPNENEIIENITFPNGVFRQSNPDIVSSPMAKRYNVARSYGLYGDDYDLQTFNKNAMGRAVAKRLNWNYEDLLSRPSKIANWRLPHESDITSGSAQEVQLYPYFLATQKGTANTSVNRVIDPRNPSTVNRVEIPPTIPSFPPTTIPLFPPPPPPRSSTASTPYFPSRASTPSFNRENTDIDTDIEYDDEIEDDDDEIEDEIEDENEDEDEDDEDENENEEEKDGDSNEEMLWDEEEIIPSNNFWSNNTSTIFLRLGVYDEVGSELLYQNFKYAPDFVQSFLKWFETDNARVTMLEGALKIEIKPDMGKLHVLGYPSLENLTEFLKVMLNPSKVKLPLL